MSSLQELETAVKRLSREDLALFRDWFADFEYAAWDRQLESDIAAGRLDKLADEALRERREGFASSCGPKST